MSTTTPNDDVRSIMDQRRQRFLFNRPNVRLELVSPYPKYTEFQLNMRRKAEILKYDGSRQSSMSNSFTRKENWSKIVNGSTSIKTTNYNIDNNLINTRCVVNKNLPTLTTRCDVPGIPILLYNDPDVPLYNYNNQMYNRTYATEIIEETAKWYAFTNQYTEFFKSDEMYIDEDAEESIQTRTIDIGVIEITKLHMDSTQLFNINIPIAFWIMGVQYDVTVDSAEYNYDPLFNSSIGKTINVSIISATVNVYYNETLVNLDGTHTVNIANVKSFEFNTKELIKDYYALQYIGNVNIANLLLPTSSGYIYTIKLVVKYGYSKVDVFSKIRLFSSGVIPHVDSRNYVETHNCKLLSTSPEYTESSFMYYPVGTKDIYYPV